MIFLIFRRKSKIHNCPNCGEDWDEKDLGRKQKIARNLALMGEQASFMGINLRNPFYPLLPPEEDHPEKWCIPCLREYMNLDNFEMDWTKIALKAKEEIEELNP